MTTPNFSNRTLYHGDNLEFLRGMNSNCIDLIATDPPFNTGRNRSGSAGRYEDNWRWLDEGAPKPDQWSWENVVHTRWLQEIRADNAALYEVIEVTRKAHSDGAAAFLCFLGARLLEMRRILKPTGSIYLHCDHTANSYIRMVMDAIFGSKNFRNEIVWKRAQGAKNLAKRYHSEHDTIFYYVKSQDFTWNPIYLPLSQDVIDDWYRYRDENGERYNVGDLQALGSGGYEYEFLGVTRKWRYPEHSMYELLEQGRIVHNTTVPTSGRKVPGLKRYLSESKGALLGDIWSDIKLLGRRAKEATGSPDQKPLDLYQRMILASTNPGDWVLDPFCGCATTPIAAEHLGRHWVGIDRRSDAEAHIINRLLATDANRGRFIPIKDGAILDNNKLAEARALVKDMNFTFTTTVPERTDEGENAPLLAIVHGAPEPRRNPYNYEQMKAILIELFGYQCWGCDFVPPENIKQPRERFLELDHIIPKSEGGGPEIQNRALLCRPCNGDKKDTHNLTWLRQQAGYATGRRKGIRHPIELPLARMKVEQYLAQQPQPASLPAGA